MNDQQTAYSRLHGEWERRLASLETHSSVFIAMTLAAVLGLGTVYMRHPPLRSVVCGTLGALLLLGFGAFHILAAAHSFRCSQLLLWRLEQSGELGLGGIVPKRWDPAPRMEAGWFFRGVPELLKVQLAFYAALASAVWVLEGFWLWLRAEDFGWLLLPAGLIAACGAGLRWWSAVLLERERALLRDEPPAQVRRAARPAETAGAR